MHGRSRSKMSAEEKDFQAEQDLRTLIEAEKVKGSPARLKAAMAKKREMQKALSNVDGQG